MKKTKKRIIAVVTAVVLVILSWSFDRGFKTEPNASSEEAVSNTIDSIIDQRSKAKRKVISAGDSSNVIQRINVDGVIDSTMTSEENKNSILEQIRLAKEDSNVKAILLSVDSPGGGVYESRVIYEALKNSGKDVYVSMESQATSGGYYISMAGKKIFANQETITGSLGVIMSNLSAQKFLNDKGIKNQIIRSGDQKAVGGYTEDMNEETLKLYKDINTEMYNRFVEVIVQGRKMDTEKVKSLADGRVYTASQALGHGLIDKIGSEKDLIEEIKKEKGLQNPEIIEFKVPASNNNLLKSFISSVAEAVNKEIRTAADSSRIEMKYLG